MLLVPSLNDSVCFLSNFLPATSFFADFDGFDAFAMFFFSWFKALCGFELGSQCQIAVRFFAGFLANP